MNLQSVFGFNSISLICTPSVFFFKSCKFENSKLWDFLPWPTSRLGTGAAPGTFCRAGAAGASARPGARAEPGFWRKVVLTWRQTSTKTEHHPKCSFNLYSLLILYIQLIRTHRNKRWDMASFEALGCSDLCQVRCVVCFWNELVERRLHPKQAPYQAKEWAISQTFSDIFEQLSC